MAYGNSPSILIERTVMFDLFITIALGYLLWNWPMHTFIRPDGVFDGTMILAFVVAVLVWIRSLIKCF